MIAVLEAAKSSYPSRFQALAQRINDGSVEANNNLKFLESIREPCEALSKADPKQILTILPSLLAAIRMIWTLSRFYNTVDRLTGLLRKISNEIINRCCAKVDLREIFDGDVELSMVSLQESIECGVKWKHMYRQTAAAIAKANPADKSRHWRFDEASIFAQIDAFVQVRPIQWNPRVPALARAWLAHSLPSPLPWPLTRAAAVSRPPGGVRGPDAVRSQELGHQGRLRTAARVRRHQVGAYRQAGTPTTLVHRSRLKAVAMLCVSSGAKRSPRASWASRRRSRATSTACAGWTMTS